MSNPISVTIAVKLQIISDLLNPVDEDGNPMEPFITKEEIMKLLEIKE